MKRLSIGLCRCGIIYHYLYFIQFITLFLFLSKTFEGAKKHLKQTERVIIEKHDENVGKIKYIRKLLASVIYDTLKHCPNPEADLPKSIALEL